MASRSLEAEIDRLYQLAPDQFTAARNALAKTAGADAPEVRRLTKPPLAAWAINQMYWKHPELYEALIKASQELRQTHKAILAGRRGDLRAAGKAHDAALDSASKAVLSILQEDGHPATDATRQAIQTTLRALPAEERAGRLTRALQPGGFEMLAGLSIGGVRKGDFPRKAEAARTAEAAKKAEVKKKAEATSRAPTPKAETPAEKRAREQALSRAREAAARAERELRAAEHAAQREEFEAARTARESEKAVRQLEQAREAVSAAQKELEAAKAAAAAAARHSKEAQRALEAARKRSHAALEEIKS
jgi:hypothetical protein